MLFSPSIHRLWRSLCLGGLLSLGLASVGRADESAIAAFDQDKEVQPQKLAGPGNVEGWEILPGKQLFLKPEKRLKVPSSGELFVELPYFDQGYGRLDIFGRRPDGKEVKPDKHTRIVLTDSKTWMTTQLRFSGLDPRSDAELRIRLDRDPEGTLRIGKGKIQTESFKDPLFNYLIEEPWRRPYAGPTAKGIDNRTLKGKVMVGYQGWYRTPNDPYDQGWVHWGGVQKGEFGVDMWPDVSAYPPVALDKAGDIKTRSGKTAYLFSSAWPHSTRLHFSWMRKSNIDGAFMQRFLTDGTYALTGRPEWVMGNIRDAANREGRIWAVEYDVSGYPDEKLLEGIKTDWKWLIDEFGLRQDKSYARENGKLVVFVWGMAVGGRNIRPETAEAVFDFLQKDPKYGNNYVIGGLPGNWRDLGPEWQNHIKQQDGTLAWMSTRWKQDVEDFKKLGVDYFPHVKPGFSWSNLKHVPTGATDAYTDREGGAYMEKQIDDVIAAGGDRLFVGMFDEYDEATAIMPMSDDPPETPRRPGVNVRIYERDRWEGAAVSQNIPQVDLELAAGSPGKNLPETGYQAVLEGTIDAPADGSYTFSLAGPAGSRAKFKILDKELKAEPLPSDQEITVSLKAGELIPYKIEYKHGDTSGRLQLFWKSPRGSRELVPASALVDAWGRFITNQGQPVDHWMKLSGQFHEKLKAAQSRR